MMERLRNIQPLMWLIILGLGILIGSSVFTFGYAEGASYLVDDPDACVNCHVMREQYDGWNLGSHHAVATCNDCHTPHSFPNKWIVKGVNGWNHSVAFTTGNFPEHIRIKAFNADIANQNCIACHETAVSEISLHSDPSLTCVACHGNVGHGD